MENSVKLRSALRSRFTKTANGFEAVMAAASATTPDIIATYKSLKDIRSELEKVDREIKNKILTDFEEEKLEKEFEEVDKYKTRWLILEAKYENLVANSEMKGTNNNNEAIRHRIKLPKLEIPKFNGDIKTWLPFWGQFKKIHEDKNLDEEDKFVYLMQAVNIGTEARQLVESYPITKENYTKCIEHLKSRYAREDLLTQMYIRELLTLIINRENNESLTSLYDKLNAQLQSLETLGVMKKNAVFILPIVESALPEEVLKIWQRAGAHDNDMEKELNNLLAFLKTEVENDQRLKMARMNFKQETGNVEQYNNESTASALLTQVTKEQKKYVCLWCDKENHTSMECYKLQKLTLEQKREIVMKKKACTICLKKGHFYKNCKAVIKCLICQKRHSTMLCNYQREKEEKKPTKEKPSADTTTTAASSASSATPVPTSNVVLLQTVVVEIEHKGKKIPVRALFDSGSQRSYIQDDVVKKLEVPVSKEEVLTHSLFGGMQTNSKSYKMYKIKINSLDHSFSSEIMALSQNVICNNVYKYNPKSDSNLDKILRQNNIILTDNNEYSDEIGLLIGADFAGIFITGQVLQLQDNGLVAINTKLGWTLQGKQVSMNASNITTALFCSNKNNDLTGYWCLETLGIRDPAEQKTKEEAEIEVMTSFEESIKRNEENRYEVRLPFKTGFEDLLPNYNIAKKRLDSVTKKIISSGKFKEYHDVFQEWHNLGIIEKVSDSDMEHDKGHYLPHRAVIKESSLTSTLRPVFDASAKDKNGLCLNACLEKGMNMIDHIPNLLIGFRTGAIGISADIQKAFLQISLPSDDRNYLKFLWWENESLENIITYRHCRVVFGLTSSPFLLSATLMHHLNNSTGPCAELLKRSWYVDNCLTSLDTEAETVQFIEESKQIMQEAKFNLRMWVTSPLKINEAGKDVISVLGLNWDTKSDELYCNCGNLPAIEDIKEVSKRALLSLMQRIFDPIGYTAPVMLIPKLILQETWRRELSWDNELPHDLFKNFLDWYKDLTYLNDCRIPRRLSADIIKESELSLHLFCDASKDGYAAGVVLRAEKDSKVSVQLVSAKTRVTPPKQISIPRLELLATLIGSRLLSQIKANMALKNCATFCWTDSSVVLCWIKRELHLNNFVGNRIKEIRHHTDINDWRHIPGTENWADLASRGCTAKTLLDCRWWEGPAWLRLAPEQWPQSEIVVDDRDVLTEVKKTVCSAQVCINENLLTNLQNYFSKYTKLIRTVAWILRFLYNTQHVDNKKKGEITYNEYGKAEKIVIKLIQETNEEYIQRGYENVSKYKDNEGLLRIKTKLTLSDFPESIRAPYLLPAKNPVVKLLVRQRHEQLQHVGVDQLIVDLRARFWIVGVRRLAKSIISNCVVCKRYRSKPAQVTTAPLPLERVVSSAPFQNTGVDLAGPLFLRNGEKVWIVLYTCAVYRAVHLELTRSLSTDAFIMTLRRFVARRRRPELIMSDQGTNFHGTRSLLSSLDWEEVQRHSSIRRIEWKMNAPTAAWWGGFWERLIRVMKDLLRRIIGNAVLTFDELETLLCECEAVMNGRPLTYINNDSGDCLEPLTPAHFLQPAVNPANDVSDFNQIDSNSLNNRLKFLQSIRVQFEERFKTEYLTLLVQKGKETHSNLKVGDVVLIETAEKRIKWPLGVIQKLIAGRDGVERTAEVKTTLGIKIRPIQRLCSLEISSESIGKDLNLISSKPSAQEDTQNTGQLVKPTLSQSAGEQQRADISSETQSRSGRQVKIPSKFNIYHRY